MRQGLMGLVTRLVGEKEEFMRAYPPVPEGKYKVVRDLFDNLTPTGT
jgi:hypothetical protein